MCRAASKAGRAKKSGFYVDENCHPQTIAVVQGRAEPIGVEVIVGSLGDFDPEAQGAFGLLIQYPDTSGHLGELGAVCERAHAAGALVVCATDLLALTLAKAPGEFGADIAVGSSQRFGVSMGFGGPHAAFLATREEFRRQLPGRIVGVSKDARGRQAYRLALQTREQHIRRDRATSNICTAQVLLAIIASMYAVYHGPAGLRAIAERVRRLTARLAAGLSALGLEIASRQVFDTLRVVGAPDDILARARARRINLRDFGNGDVGISLDETTTEAHVRDLLELFGETSAPEVPDLGDGPIWSDAISRDSGYLEHEVFHRYQTEHEMLRYLHRLQSRDLSLTSSMIPLGSCTMKLNATAEMLPVTWPEFAGLHPFAPADQAEGYRRLHDDLERWLAEITGFAAISLQPNAGAQGEYAGLLVIRAYHKDRGDDERDVCLIPVSAHGTNPASAVMAGFRVVSVQCDEQGNIDVADLRAKAEEHRERLGALMITYPSTHGVFERPIKEICDIVHQNGGQVYLDGANMNAQVGLCRPGDYGADVCHLNLHKTFCIPHGGGGPGMGPIGVGAHLADYLPGHPHHPEPAAKAIAPVSAAPFGSPSILPISWMYIAMMGREGLEAASQLAIANANYMAARLEGHYDILYTGESGRVAHEFIIDLRPLKKATGVGVDDVAKRLMDYGFHAPTMSWPVASTLMIEPTESESKAELDRFCDAMIRIRDEIRHIEEGRVETAQSPLKFAPHTAEEVCSTEWDRVYSRETAAFPGPWLRDGKFWPSVARIDNAFGDRNLVCTCPPMESYED